MKSNPGLSSAPSSRLKGRRLLVGAGLLAVAAAICAFPITCLAGSRTSVEPAPEEKAGTLSGVELWTLHCSRCHTYRASNEFTAAEWQTLLMHMRIRANLPAAQAREVLKFLQAGSGK